MSVCIGFTNNDVLYLEKLTLFLTYLSPPANSLSEFDPAHGLVVQKCSLPLLEKEKKRENCDRKDNKGKSVNVRNVSFMVDSIVINCIHFPLR